MLSEQISPSKPVAMPWGDIALLDTPYPSFNMPVESTGRLGSVR
uniref:Uncharacterized protein n=1 Tax=Anguilla anguilla TaxID=7936 RepID=A0A0E9TXV9_ANGAN